MDLSAIICACLSSAVGAAVITQIGALILNRVQRKDTKADKNDSVLKKLDELDKKIDNLSTHIEETAAVQSRVRILRFWDDYVHANKKMSKDYWRQTLEDVRVYQEFCKAHPGFRNDITTITIQNITDTYSKLSLTDDFL